MSQWETWWSMGAGRRFLREVQDALDDGSVVVIGMPRLGPEEFPEALRVFPNRGLSYVVRVKPLTPEEAEKPAEVLKTIGGPHANDRAESEFEDRTALRGAEGSMDQGRVCIVLCTVYAEEWQAWRKAILAYVQERRNKARGGALIAIVTEGLSERELRIEDVGLRCFLWRGRVSRLEMESFAREHAGEWASGTIGERLRFRLIAELSLWDAWLAKRLCDAPLSELLEPLGLLKRLAEERGMSASFGFSEGWPCGRSDEYEGVVEVSSLELAAIGNEEAIRRRLWRAQVGLLFPKLEEHRHNLIERNREPLDDFVRQRCKDLKNADEAEIKHICEWFESTAPSCEEHKRAMKLRSIRNDIAHLRVVPEGLLRVFER